MSTATPLPPPRVLDTPRCIWDAGAELGEGTVWSQREQALYWLDILGRKLYRYRPADGARSSWDFDEEISALAERANGQGLIVTLRRGFALFDPAEQNPQPRYLHQPPEEPASNRFNDGKCDAQGRFWGGSMDYACEAPTGALYRFDPDGRCTRHIEGVAVSNGPAFSLDGRTLYFNETVRGRIRAYDLDPATGTLRNEREWLRLPKGAGLPDGMTTDAAGRLWLCHWAGARVTCLDPVTAQELCRIDLPTDNITDCAFGGPDLRTLYISSAWNSLSAEQRTAQPLAGALFAVTLADPGLPAAQFAG